MKILLVITVAVAGATSALMGCNTTRGIGIDMQDTGENIQRGVQSVTNGTQENQTIRNETSYNTTNTTEPAKR